MEIYIDDFDTHLLLSCSSGASFRRTSFFRLLFVRLVNSVLFLSHSFSLFHLPLSCMHTLTYNKWHYFETGTHSVCHIIFISKSIILTDMMRERQSERHTHHKTVTKETCRDVCKRSVSKYIHV